MNPKIPNKIYQNKIHQLIEVNPRGFCHGVVNSYITSLKYVKSHPDEKIYMLGRIVHNDNIVQELINLGIIFIEDINKKREDLVNEVPPGSTIIFSAHGSSIKAFMNAKKRGIKIVNTTCDRVYVTHDAVKEKLDNGYEVIFVGTKNHPETQSVYGLNENKIKLIYSIDDIKKLNLKSSKIFVTNQTTLSILDVQEIIDELKRKFPHLEFKNDICYATYDRQTAVLDLKDQNIDLLVVVGDKKSNNSNKLHKIGLNVAKKSILIQNHEQLPIDLLKRSKVVALTSGASTPTKITKEVSNLIKQTLNL